jgi:hypothetical protein
VRVKLCFFVKVRKAKGLNVAGGSKIGSILAFDGTAETLKDLIGCAGVANAGEEEGIGFKGAGVGGGRNMGAARGFSD